MNCRRASADGLQLVKNQSALAKFQQNNQSSFLL